MTLFMLNIRMGMAIKWMGRVGSLGKGAVSEVHEHSCGYHIPTNIFRCLCCHLRGRRWAERPDQVLPASWRTATTMYAPTTLWNRRQTSCRCGPDQVSIMAYSHDNVHTNDTLKQKTDIVQIWWTRWNQYHCIHIWTRWRQHPGVQLQ